MAEKGSSPVEAITAGLIAPLKELQAGFAAATETIDIITRGLQEVAREAVQAASGARVEEPADEGQPGERRESLRPQRTAAEAAERSRLRSTTSPEFQRLLVFQDDLTNIPGVASVTVAGVGAGGTKFLVELESVAEGSRRAAEPEPPPAESPTLICAWCGRLIARGGPQVSHGLCPECSAPFVDRGRGGPDA
jgi:hypothetical protein